MSKLFVDINIALRSLIQHSRRALFLGTAIGSVTALLILLTGLSTGIRETMIETATTLSSGHLNVGGFYKVTAGQAAPVVTDYQRALDVATRSLPEMAFAVERGRGWAKLVSDTGSMQVGISGIDIRHEPRFPAVLQILSGKLDDLAEPGTILIFENQAEKLNAKVGDALTISAPTTRGSNNTLDVRVVAIARGIGLLSMWNTYVPMASLRALYQLNQTSTGVIQIMLRDQYVPRIPELAARLRTDLEKAGFRIMTPDPRAFWMKFQSVAREDWTGQKLDVTSWEDELSFMMWTLQALQGLTGILITILVAIVVIGIMNTMWIAIRERTREIGTLRAIGMQRGGVLWMFLLESLLLRVPISVQLFLMSDHLHLAIHPGAIARAMLLITVITGVAALYPSLRAARLKPVTAMQHFG
jgi:ABC-type lipoprotein release transport system permease subunit